MCRRKQTGHNFVRGRRRKIEGGSILGTCIGERQSTDSTSINPNMTLVYAETDEAAMRQAVAELGKLIFPKLRLPLQLERLTD